MTTARTVITDALTFGLNRLSAGETMDADTGQRCLDALNNIADELNGRGAFLWREVFTASASPVSTSTGTIGTTWAGLDPGVFILGAFATIGTNLDIPLVGPLPMEDYASIAQKNISTLPSMLFYDGHATVYFYPVPTGYTVTLRTKQTVSDFADLDTDYTMPKGYRSALAAFLAEKMAPTMNPAALPVAKADAKVARMRLAAANIAPAIISAGDGAGPVARIQRGY